MIDRPAEAPLLERDPVAADLALAHYSGDGGRHRQSGRVGSLMPYPGGKNSAGVFQRLISLMPPHVEYIEAFLGSGALIRRKRPASRNIGIDVDAGVIAKHVDGGPRGYDVVRADARVWLRGRALGSKTLVYCDPPYLASARLRPRAIYDRELMGESDHADLLQLLTSLPAMVMISGYPSALYDGMLRGWERVEYTVQTRGGPVREVCWMNYPAPTELHDYRYLGDDFRDRCRIAKKIKRLRRKLAGLPPLERAAVIAGIGADEGGEW